MVCLFAVWISYKSGDGSIGWGEGVFAGYASKMLPMMILYDVSVLCGDVEANARG